MPGPLASANVGSDTLSAVAEPTVALRELRREIRAAEAELTSLASKGDKVSAQQTRNLEEMRRKEKAIVTIQKQQRDTIARGKRALDVGEMTKAMIGAGSVKRLLEGTADARDIAAFAFMAERQIIKGVKEVAGVRMARATRGVLKAIPFVGEAIGTLMEGWDKKKALEKSSDEINQLSRAGKIDPATSRLYYASLTEGWFNDPHATVDNVVHASRGLLRLNENEMKSTLEAVKFKRLVATDQVSAEAGVVYEQIDDSLSAKDVLKRYNELLDSDRIGGVNITKNRQEAHLRSAISSMLENDDQRDVIAEKLIEQIKKKLAEKSDDGEYLIATKWQREDGMRKDRIAAMRHLIPSKLEF